MKNAWNIIHQANDVMILQKKRYDPAFFHILHKQAHLPLITLHRTMASDTSLQSIHF